MFRIAISSYYLNTTWHTISGEHNFTSITLVKTLAIRIWCIQLCQNTQFLVSIYNFFSLATLHPNFLVNALAYINNGLPMLIISHCALFHRICTLNHAIISTFQVLPHICVLMV